VQQPADVLRAFQEQVSGAAAVAVRNTRLTLHLPKKVRARRAVRVLPLLDDLGEAVLHGATAEVSLGDLERSATYGVLFELLLEPRAAGQFSLGQLEVSYDIPLLGIKGARVKRELAVAFVSDPAQAAGVNEMVMGFAQRANAQRLVRQALDEYRRTGRTTVRMGREAASLLDEQTRAEMERLAAGQVPAEQASVIMKGMYSRTRRMTEHEDAPRRKGKAGQ
jgi:Ca-activated chloride channel family protein